MLDAVESGVEAADNADLDEQAAKARKAEENEVKALWDEYETARKFDRGARAQYAVDRRYAAGTANLNWAVTANLIGAFIDILVSFLYARNPDVSARKAKRVDPIGTGQEDDFAKTMELVISTLWKAPSARLKVNCRAQVRSTLTNGVGWLKAIVVSNGTNIPQLQNELGDIRKNLAQIEELKARLARQAAMEAVDAPQASLEFGDDAALMAPPAPAAPPVEDPENPYCAMSDEERDAEEGRLRDLEASVSNRLEVAVRKGMAVDVVAPEDMQVSLDVRSVTDHAIANWNANAIYRPIKSLAAMFPGLKESDVKSAKQYFQRRQTELEPLSDQVKLTGVADSEVDAEAAEQYSAGGNANKDENGVPFGKIVELWNRETGHVYTMIDGVKRWAKPPYQPDYPTTRFYPYFLTAFYPVDGARHPQSLTWRLMKLQDEYAATRSSLRLTRQRAAPGTIFNSSSLDPTEAAKIERSTHQEFTGIKPTDPTQPLRDIFAEKPVAVGDMRLYDTAPILADMERISGVQEALQQSSTAPKTATEAEIQQSGFASRTTADRDVLETMLTDLAHYTGELALSALDMKDAERIAGAKAFWPHGMAIDDLLSMVEVSIEAGTTGKPKSSGDRDAWGVVMPLIKESMLQIQQALMLGDKGMADALIALLQETMTRMGDDSDITRFIPQPPQLPPAMPGAPGMPGDPMAAAGGAPGEIPPGAPQEDFAGQPVNPEMQAPELAPPDLTMIQ
jgi:hypothetical protein